MTEEDQKRLAIGILHLGQPAVERFAGCLLAGVIAMKTDSEREEYLAEFVANVLKLTKMADSKMSELMTIQ